MAANFRTPNRLPYSDVPGIGPWIAKIGRIIQLWTNPCSPSPEIWVLAFFSALPTLLFTPITPSETDAAIVRIGTGASGGGGGFHGKASRFKFDVFDFAEGIGGKIDKPSWFKFEIGSWAARFLWYFVIIDATIDFAIQWESQAYQWAGCHAPSSPWASCRANGPGIWIPALTGGIFTEFGTNSSNIFFTGPTGISTPPGYEPTVAYSFSYDPSLSPPGFEPVGDLELVDGGTGEVLDHVQFNANPDGTGTGQNLLWGYLKGTAGHNYQFRFTGTGWFYFSSVTLDANAMNLKDMFYPLIHGGHPKYGK